MRVQKYNASEKYEYAMCYVSPNFYLKLSSVLLFGICHRFRHSFTTKHTELASGGYFGIAQETAYKKKTHLSYFLLLNDTSEGRKNG